MSLQYIIDGYNIINHPLFAHIRKKTEDSRTELLEFIKTKRLCGSSKNRITVVFDGYFNSKDERIEETGIDVVFSRKETADERIKKIFESRGNPRNIVVVSDDKEIKFFVKSAGGQSVGVEEFINRKEKLKNHKRDLLKPELTYSQIYRINQELKKIWLK